MTLNTYRLLQESNFLFLTVLSTLGNICHLYEQSNNSSPSRRYDNASFKKIITTLNFKMILNVNKTYKMIYHSYLALQNKLHLAKKNKNIAIKQGIVAQNSCFEEFVSFFLCFPTVDQKQICLIPDLIYLSYSTVSHRRICSNAFQFQTLRRI